MSGPGLAIVAGGALAYYAFAGEGEDGAGAHAAPPPNRGGGNVIEDPHQSWKKRNTAQAGNLINGGQAVYSPVVRTAGSPAPQGIVGDQEQIDRAAKATMNQLKAEAAKAYADMTDVERARGADALNHTLKPSPQLTGHETWEEAGQKIGASIGAAGATAAVSVIPGVGPLLAATGLPAVVGALIGGYLGGKVGGWMKKYYGKVEAWAEETWDDATDWVSDTASDAYHEVASWF